MGMNASVEKEIRKKLDKIIEITKDLAYNYGLMKDIKKKSHNIESLADSIKDNLSDLSDW